MLGLQTEPVACHGLARVTSSCCRASVRPMLEVGLDAGGRQLAGRLLLVAAVGDEGERVGLHEQHGGRAR